METNTITEFVNNEEIVTMTNDLMKNRYDNVMLIGAGVGLAITIVGLLYRYALKPAMPKIKKLVKKSFRVKKGVVIPFKESKETVVDVVPEETETE